MPDDLAALVREAARFSPWGEGGKPTPELSAVRTNVRPHRSGIASPRFWYMLPDFMPRHLPAAFVPRIIDGVPWVERNLGEPILVDANFSTFWTSDSAWTGYAVKALLNSTLVPASHGGRWHADGWRRTQAGGRALAFAARADLRG
jgi:hypothetical protein